MVGSEAVIGLPDTGEVLKYALNAQSTAGVQPMPEAQQTLIDASIRQDSGRTILSFTKILEEPGEIPILLEGDNTFLSAWGFGNNLGLHAARGSFTLSGRAIETRRQGLWKAHGWFAAIAWALLSPLAIASSVLRRFLPREHEGLWFKVHRSLNLLVVSFTILAVIIAITAINQETPSGADSNHFNRSFSRGHRSIGLAIFLLAFFQALGGILRPHLPSKPSHMDEEDGRQEAPLPQKSFLRSLWEVGHKVVGLTILGLCWYQVQLGVKTYNNIFNSGDGTAALPLFWTVVSILGGMIIVGYISKVFY